MLSNFIHNFSLIAKYPATDLQLNTKKKNSDCLLYSDSFLKECCVPGWPETGQGVKSTKLPTVQ